MKKLAGFLVCVALLSVLMCMCAFADVAQIYPKENGAYDVEYQGTANEYYVVLVVSGTYSEGQTPAISEQTILYIDQVTADSNGVAAFDDFKVNNAVDGTIYIGGSVLDNAVLYGHLACELPTSVVSGTVGTELNRPATVTLTDTLDQTKIYSVQTSSAAFEITVSPATYKMTVTSPGHLSYTKNAFNVSNDVSVNVTLKGGDVRQDDKVDFFDLAVVLNNYGEQTSEGDVNGDGNINISDLQSVLENYRHTSTVVD